MTNRNDRKARAHCRRVEAGRALADVAWRPVQVYAPRELSLLRSLGRRIVVSQLDFIGYGNPIYFPDAAAWRRFRDTTRLSLAVADGVGFVSRYSAAEAVA